MNSNESEHGAAKADAIGNGSVGEKVGSQRGNYISHPNSGIPTNRSLSNLGETEMSPTTVKLQPSRGFIAQLDGNQNRDKKATDNFGNRVKDYEAKQSYVISWKSDSLKKRYEKVVG